jgi:diguanylate cyclase (GGDEF)-like protein
MGGEEFVLLLPETDQARAIVVVDRVLNAVREAVISTDAGDTLKITVSIGLVTLTPQTPDLMALLQQADEALYEAKETGRNRYQVFSGSA